MAKKDETPDLKLLKCSEKGDLEGIKEHLGAGASVNALDDGQNSPLHLASYRGHLNVVEHLLKNGADPMKGNENKDIPLHLAALANRLAVVKTLLDAHVPAKSDLEARDAQGYCPLHYACGEGHVQVAKYLIKEAKARVDSRNMDGLTPIMCAVQQGHTVIAQMLLDHEPSVINHTNNSKDTPLHYATISDAGIKMVELLLRAGADPDLKNSEGHTPLVEAIMEKKADCAELLKKCMASYKQEKGYKDFTAQERAEVFKKILDGTWKASSGAKAEVDTNSTKAQETAHAAGAVKAKSKFSSARAGLRTKTTVEVVREEFEASGIASKPKPKSRIMQPSSTFQF